MPATDQPPRSTGLQRLWPVLIGVLLLGAMAVFVSLRLKVSSDITAFLAAGDDVRLAKLSRQLAESAAQQRHHGCVVLGLAAGL